jgi:hypothetical protein
MERTTSLIRAKEIMGSNIIGPGELKSVKTEMGITVPNNILDILPLIQFSEDLLERNKHEYLLILGISNYKDGTPLTLVKMREHFGWDPEKSKPCFYNQDWYLLEQFANKTTLENKWYLLKKDVYEEYRGMSPNIILNRSNNILILPTAILCAYTFFAYYYNSGGDILLKNNFVWCSDKDINNDQIYVGRYNDSKGLNKDGFNIHRHLSIKNNFGYISEIQPQ